MDQPVLATISFPLCFRNGGHPWETVDFCPAPIHTGCCDITTGSPYLFSQKFPISTGNFGVSLSSALVLLLPILQQVFED